MMMGDDATIDRETRTLSQRLRRGTQRFLQEPIPLPLLRKYVPPCMGVVLKMERDRGRRT